MDKPSLAERIARYSQPEPNTGCVLWTGTSNKGKRGEYGRINVDGKLLLAHRVAWELVNGPIAPGVVICHDCDVTLCVNVDHLSPGTQRKNMQDCIKRGRDKLRVRGEKHHRSKLTEAKVRDIRTKGAIGMRQRDIAKEYGMSRCQINKVINRVTWTHVE